MAKRLMRRACGRRKEGGGRAGGSKKQRRASTMPGKAHDAQGAIKAEKARKHGSDRNDDGVLSVHQRPNGHPITGQTLKNCPYHATV